MHRRIHHPPCTHTCTHTHTHTRTHAHKHTSTQARTRAHARVRVRARCCIPAGKKGCQNAETPGKNAHEHPRATQTNKRRRPVVGGFLAPANDGSLVPSLQSPVRHYRCPVLTCRINTGKQQQLSSSHRKEKTRLARCMRISRTAATNRDRATERQRAGERPREGGGGRGEGGGEGGGGGGGGREIGGNGSGEGGSSGKRSTGGVGRGDHVVVDIAPFTPPPFSYLSTP